MKLATKRLQYQCEPRKNRGRVKAEDIAALWLYYSVHDKGGILQIYFHI